MWTAKELLATRDADKALAEALHRDGIVLASEVEGAYVVFDHYARYLDLLSPAGISAQVHTGPRGTSCLAFIMSPDEWGVVRRALSCHGIDTVTRNEIDLDGLLEDVDLD